MPSDPLTNDPETLIQASLKRSISDSVVLGPRLTRTAARASCAGTPMAESTCEGWTLPEEQAAPEETAIPSRSNAITAVSAFIPGTANRVVLGSRSAAAPKMTTSGEAALRRASSLSRSAAMRALRAKPVARCRCRRAEARDGGHVLGAGPQVALLTAALDQRIEEVKRPRSPNERADALGGADLVPGQGQKISPEGVDIAGNSTRGLDRVDMQRAARRVDYARSLRNRLNNAGLVVGKHERNERSALERSHAPLECRKVDLPASAHRQALDSRRREPPAGEHRGMLDRRNQELAARRFLGCRHERQHVGLGAARGEHHAARLGSHQPGHLLPRLLDQTARGAALDVDRGRITGHFQRGERGRARLLPQRRAGVPVKINTLGHGPGSRRGGPCPQTSAARATPFETLAFCPRTRVRKAPAATGRCLNRRRRLPKSGMVLDTYVCSATPSSVH